MFYLFLYIGLFTFIGISAAISIVKYKKFKHNKTVGIHDNLYKEKFDMTHKVNNYNIGYHMYIDYEKQKWAIICDNPKSCDIFPYSSLQDYALVLDGETTVRSSMKSVITEMKAKKCSFITLDIFTDTNKYHIVFLNHQENVRDGSFQVPYQSACAFCDMLDQIIG